MSAEVDHAKTDSDEVERGRLLILSSKEQEQYGRGRLLQITQRKWEGREVRSPTRGSSVPPRGILVSKQNRQHDQDKSSDDFDSESSVLISKMPNSRRRSRSIPRKARGSDSSTSTSTKKTTFHTEVVNLGEGKTTHLSTLNIGMDNASIKSTSSNDISRISFQGKRALFEEALHRQGAVRTHTDTPAAPGLAYQPSNDNHDLSAVEERNKKLEQELYRLEQTADLREEVARRLREKVEKMEEQMEERDRSREREVTRHQEEKRQKEEIIEELGGKLEQLRDKLEDSLFVPGQHEQGYVEQQGAGLVLCKFMSEGCMFTVASMRDHELYTCSFRPTRCPSLTCQERPAAARLVEHIGQVHDGNVRGKDVVVRTGSNQLVSSYVNVDREPVFYNSNKMSWVANELVWGLERFYMECVREPPEWFLWVWHAGCGAGRAEEFVATIRLFKVGEEREVGGAERSWTGAVIPLSVGREEIVAKGAGFMVNDKQVRPLCGPILDNEEQLFGYEVIVERKV